ncbi:hypothetical protein G5I_10058 [Acromyrmex echinatior]|uniref:Uncharacterized protein n=1 Tax=Acromyrmex echinatior TaxID=103372 RepID=F4WVV5_ACREC|nr:hypothetical protein G5I_10058 [Acromyrmex echinatior]
MTTMAATAAADESSGVDRKDGKDVHFAKSSLRIAVQRRRESADTKRDDQNEYNQWRKEEKERSEQLECRFILACCEEKRILFIFPAALAATLLVRCKVFYDGSSVPTAPLLNGIRPEAG